MFSPRLARPRNRTARRGSVAFEVVLILPVLLLVALGMIGLADLVVGEQLLADASGRVARLVAVNKPEDEIATALTAILGEERAAHARLIIRPVGGEAGDPIPSGAVFEVRVELAARYATGTRLALVDPDEILVGRAVMQRE